MTTAPRTRTPAGRYIAVLVMAAVLALTGCGGGSRGHRPRAAATVAPVSAATWGRYVALGDSYSSGEGAGAFAADSDTRDDRCHRSAHAYPHAVDRDYHFAAGMIFWACSGATTQTMRHGQCFTAGTQHGATGPGCEPAQLGRVDARTSLVTFSIGGNDLGFAPVLRTCVLGSLARCTGQQRTITAARVRLRTDLRSIILDVHHRAPYARIVVLGYPRLFPTRPAGSADLLDVAKQRWLNTMADQADAAVKGIVMAADAVIAKGKGGSAEFVDARKAFTGHEIGTAAPYLNGILLSGMVPLPGSFHPTADGQRAFAAVVDQQISAGPGRPLAAKPAA